MTTKKYLIIDEIRSASSLEEISSVLKKIELSDLTPRNFSVISRCIEKDKQESKLKIAYLSNFVIDMLPNFVNVFAAKEGYAVSHYMSGYNQYYQEILNDHGELKNYAPNVIFLALSMRKLNVELSQSFAKLSKESKRGLADEIVQHISACIDNVSSRFDSNILVSNFPLPAYPQMGVADQKDPFGEMLFYYDLNSRINELIRSIDSAFIFDTAKLYTQFGYDNVYDPKMYYIAKMEWRDTFLVKISEELNRLITAIEGRAKKCLVLDLDNTLWGGVIGEEGPSRIKVGVGDPSSEAFADFQKKILSLKDRGVILAICSKNNEEDVLEAFNTRDDMPIKITDFAAVKANWVSKTQNIVELSEELNIGLESLVFIDDNPAECHLVRNTLPEVTTILLPKDPSLYPSLIDGLSLFEKTVVLESDRNKTIKYKENQQRKAHLDRTDDLEIYLKSLGTEISIRKPTTADIERIHQLFTKTNQFNVTTIRYSLPQIKSIVEMNDKDLYIVDACDKFGDLGTIGLYVVRYDEDIAKIDSFILSCRAMGRGIESAVMNQLKHRSFEERQAKEIEAIYNPTKKNKPVENFYEEQGYEVTRKEKNGDKTYSIGKTTFIYMNCDWIKVS